MDLHIPGTFIYTNPSVLTKNPRNRCTHPYFTMGETQNESNKQPDLSFSQTPFYCCSGSEVTLHHHSLHPMGWNTWKQCGLLPHLHLGQPTGSRRASSSVFFYEHCSLCQGPHSFVLHPLSPGLLRQPPGQSFCLNPLQSILHTVTGKLKHRPDRSDSSACIALPLFAFIVMGVGLNVKSGITLLLVLNQFGFWWLFS